MEERITSFLIINKLFNILIDINHFKKLYFLFKNNKHKTIELKFFNFLLIFKY